MPASAWDDGDKGVPSSSSGSERSREEEEKEEEEEEEDEGSWGDEDEESDEEGGWAKIVCTADFCSACAHVLRKEQ